MSEVRCCGVDSPLEQIKELYTDLALRPEKDFGWAKGKENARRLGYDASWLERIPDAVWESAAAVGNPFSVGVIRRGETVVDLGCGAGADLCIAALLVGEEGHVFGVDATPAMVAKANANATLAGLRNVEIHEGDMAQLRMMAEGTDVVISNGAINLALDKTAVFNEVFRILRHGGRFQFADIVRDETSEPNCAPSNGDSWAGCISGTLPAERVLSMLRQAGFSEAAAVCATGYHTSPSTTGFMFRAVKP